MLRSKRRSRRKRKFGPPGSQQDSSVRRLSQRAEESVRLRTGERARDAEQEGERKEAEKVDSRGPRSDLTQDPVRLQRALENLRVEHSELWLTANELKDKIRDLLEEKATFEELLRRYRDLFYLAPDPQLLTDGTGRVRDLNFAACRLFHADPTLMTQSSLFDCIDPQEEPLLRDTIARICQGQTADVHLKLKTRLGAKPTVRLRGCLLPTLSDQILFVLQRV